MNAKTLSLLIFIWCTSWLMAEPFTASSLKSGFSIVGTFSGEYRKHWVQENGQTIPVIKVSVDKGEIYRSPHCTNFPKRKVRTINAFLASRNPEAENFKILASSREIKINEILDLGESVIGADKIIFNIPIKEITPLQLKQSWLGFTISSELVDEGQTKNRVGFCYTHMETLLFGKEKSGM